MKRIKIIGILFSFLFLGSCAKDEDYYSLNNIWISLGIIDTNGSTGYDYAIYIDNGDTLLPIVNDVPFFEEKDNQRVLVNFTPLDEVGNSSQKFYVKINNLQEVLFKDVIKEESSTRDSIGHDPITITNLWVVNDFMNIEFTYRGGIQRHFINLTYNTNENGELEQPVELEFRHNANNDKANDLLPGIVTFRLNDLQIAGQDSINYVVSYTDLDDENQTISGIYSY